MAEEYRHLNQRRLHRQGRQTQQGLQLVADAPLTLGVAVEPGIGFLANHVERDLLRVIVTLIETRVEQRRGLARQIFERRSAAIGSRDQSGHRAVFKPERSVQRGDDRGQRDVETIWRGDDVARSEEHTSELQSLMRISYAV